MQNSLRFEFQPFRWSYHFRLTENANNFTWLNDDDSCGIECSDKNVVYELDVKRYGLNEKNIYSMRL